MVSISSKKSCNKNLSLSTSASIIGHNSDPLTEILYRLPVKSLGIFKIVSKQWLSLISDPYFERNYTLRNRCLSIPALFIKRRLMKKGWIKHVEVETLVMDDYIPLDTPVDVYSNWRITFKHSCNGLVLCEVLNGPNDTTFVIWNPSMKHCKTLPSFSLRKSDVRYVNSATIAFDPSKSSYYEIVGVCNFYTNKDMHQIRIYSSKTDSWRAAGDPFPLSLAGGLSSGVYWNGSVHWIDNWSATLHYFDIECEVMKKIAMPTVDVRMRNIVYFGECRGHMHLIKMDMDEMPRYDIWEMQEDYTGWKAKYYVDLTALRNLYPGALPAVAREYLYIRSELYVLLVDEGEDSSRLILWVAKEKVIISFDLKTKSFKKIYDLNPDVFVNGFQYMETLAHA